MTKWKRFEDLAAAIQRTLAPLATVEQNVHLVGRDSGARREIDILVRAQVGQYELLVVLDCKDYKARVDVKDVEAFLGLLKDVGAHKGAMVAANGFSAAAKKRASREGISLYRPVDTYSEDWNALLRAPVVVDQHTFSSYRVTFSDFQKLPRSLSDASSLELFLEGGSSLGSIRDLVATRWNSGEFPRTAGLHEGLPLSETPTFVMLDGQFLPVTVRVDVQVERRLYLGQVPLINVKGFHDEVTGALVTRSLTLDIGPLEEVEKSWKRIAEISESPLPPLVVMEILSVPSVPSEPSVPG